MFRWPRKAIPARGETAASLRSPTGWPLMPRRVPSTFPGNAPTRPSTPNRGDRRSALRPRPSRYGRRPRHDPGCRIEAVRDRDECPSGSPPCAPAGSKARRRRGLQPPLLDEANLSRSPTRTVPASGWWCRNPATAHKHAAANWRRCWLPPKLSWTRVARQVAPAG